MLNMGIRDKIKSIIVAAGWNYVELAEEMTKATGRKYTNQLISNRIRKEIISFKEMELICGIIGYNIEFCKNSGEACFLFNFKDFF